jgi:hypothetical protein
MKMAALIIYHRAGQGSSSGGFPYDFGHVFIEALDEETGENLYLDVWREEDGRLEVNRELTNSRRQEHDAVFIEVPFDDVLEATYKMREALRSSSGYELFSNSCVSATAAILLKVGIDVGDVLTPNLLWNKLEDIPGIILSSFNISSIHDPNIFDDVYRYVPVNPKF